MKKFWMFSFIAVMGLLFLLFFTNDFGLMDIQKTSFIIAMGIDKGEQDGKINVTAQVAIPDEAEGVKASDISVDNIETIGDAIAKVNLKTGWYPSLVHCRLIVLGKDILSANVFDSLNYFLENNVVEDSCLIATSNKTASETLKATSPIGEVTANAISKVLSSEAQKTGSVSVSTLREFAKSYFSPSKSGYLPTLDIRAEADNASGGSGSNTGNSSGGSGGGSQGGSSGSSSGSSDSSGGSSADIIDASQTDLFYDGKFVGRMNADQTLAFNIAKTSTHYAFANVDALVNGELTNYALKIKIVKKAMKVTMENGVPVLRFTIRGRVDIEDSNKSTNLLGMVKESNVPEAVLKSLEEKINRNLTEIVTLSGQTNCDIFEVIDNVHKRYYDKYKAEYDTLLQKVKPLFDVKFLSSNKIL